MIYYKKKIQQDVGATAVEYGILSALIAVVTILSLQATGTNLGTTYCTIANQLSQAVGAGATASGCSATSSPSNGTGTGAGTGAGTSAGTTCDSSSLAHICDASNSYTLANEYKEPSLQNFAISDVQSLSGFYDANGNEITTPQEYAEALGVSADDYNTLANIYKTPGTSTLQAEVAIDQDVNNNLSDNVYIPDFTKATMTTSNGTIFSYSDISSSNASFYEFKPTSGTSGNNITLGMNAPTGN
nr:Flp family type IVb pilin [uncultured Acetobacter sp.]